MSEVVTNRTFLPNGNLVRQETIDLATDKYTLEVNGAVVEARALTVEERLTYGPQPLDQAGALATLLAVLELSSVQDAANAVGLTEQDLVAEAEAWQLVVDTTP